MASHLDPEDVHAVIDGECRSRRVGPLALLAPVDTFGEIHRQRAVLGRGIALDPQQAALRVRDCDEQTGVGGVLDEQFANHRADECHRMPVAVAVEVRPTQGRCLTTAVRVDTLGSTSHPRVEYDGPHRRAVCTDVVDERLMGTGHLARQHSDILTGAHCDPGVAATVRSACHSTLPP